MDKQYYEQQASFEEYLEWYKQQDLPTYDKPSLTVDCVIFRYYQNRPQILMIKRKAHPFIHKYALPGGFVNKDEDILDAVIREVEEETSVRMDSRRVEQLYTVGTPFRDPRQWVVSVAHTCYLTPNENQLIQAGDDAESVHWVDVFMENGVLRMLEDGEDISTNIAFDHFSIVQTAMERVKGRLTYNPTILNIMPRENTMSQYRELFGAFDEQYAKMNSTDFKRKFKGRFVELDKRVPTATRKAHLFKHVL